MNKTNEKSAKKNFQNKKVPQTTPIKTEIPPPFVKSNTERRWCIIDYGLSANMGKKRIKVTIPLFPDTDTELLYDIIL